MPFGESGQGVSVAVCFFMYSGDQAEEEVHADLYAGHGRVFVRSRELTGDGGSLEAYYSFDLCAAAVCREQYAEKAALADWHVGQGEPWVTQGWALAHLGQVAVVSTSVRASDGVRRGLTSDEFAFV